MPGWMRYILVLPQSRKCEFLLTWNFRRIANVRIRKNVERILGDHGYKTTICTPEELI